MLFFGSSLNAIPWCYSPEILPLKARAKGTSIAVCSNWVFVSVARKFWLRLDYVPRANTCFLAGFYDRDGYAVYDCEYHLENISRFHVMRTWRFIRL
jgi:hypothetical protein